MARTKSRSRTHSVMASEPRGGRNGAIGIQACTSPEDPAAQRRSREEREPERCELGLGWAKVGIVVYAGQGRPVMKYNFAALDDGDTSRSDIKSADRAVMSS